MFRSILFRGDIISWPQPRHLSLKSMPTRSTCHWSLPQGCFFFIVSLSPTCISIVMTSSYRRVPAHIIIAHSIKKEGAV